MLEARFSEREPHVSNCVLEVYGAVVLYDRREVAGAGENVVDRSVAEIVAKGTDLVFQVHRPVRSDYRAKAVVHDVPFPYLLSIITELRLHRGGYRWVSEWVGYAFMGGNLIGARRQSS